MNTNGFCPFRQPNLSAIAAADNENCAASSMQIQESKRRSFNWPTFLSLLSGANLQKGLLVSDAGASP
jgi:hypothetical protein